MTEKRMNRPACAFLVLLLLLAALPAGGSAAEKENGVIRVLLTRLKLTDRLDVSLDGSYTLNGISFQRGSRLVISLSGGRLMVYYEGMALECGQSLRLVRHQLLSGERGTENGLRLNGDFYLHPGDLAVSVSDGQLRAVLHAPVEEYLWGVVPYEMSDSYPLEALKAQAVCSRTYALFKKAGSDRDYDVVDNTNDQAYYGVQAQFTRSLEAISATEGICGYDRDGSLIQCYYSASNGGQTECASHVWGGADLYYLQVRDDPYDLANPASTVRTWRVGKTAAAGFGPLESLLIEKVKEKLDPADGPEEITPEDLSLVSCLPADPMHPGSMVSRSLLFVIDVSCLVPAQSGAEEEIYMDPLAARTVGETQSGEKVRATRRVTVSLPVFTAVESACQLDINQGSSNEIVTVRETDDAFILESRRFGHGVGMSQRGAQWMAQEYGLTVEAILSFYYPGASFTRGSSAAVSMPTPVSAAFLTTPGPPATPTPRPTLMPVDSAAARGQYLVIVSNIAENSYLNLRSQPSMNAPVLRQLYYGQLLSVLDVTEDGWLHVCTDSAEGYVSAAFVTSVQ